MSKRKICCFCERWASGGIESFLSNLLCRMDLEELEVDIVAAALEKNDLSARLEAKGVRFIALSGHIQHFAENYRLFRRLLRRRQYDVVHLNLYQGLSLYYCRIARQEGIPVRIVHSHNSNLRKSPARWLKMLLHRLGRHCFTQDATALWACSDAAAAFLFAPSVLAQRGFNLIPNGIDTARFRFHPALRQTRRAELGLSDCLVLGNVGRLCQQKNQSFLLEVLARLTASQPNSRLLLVGEGDDRQMLERRAKELGIAPQVIFCGHSDHVEQLLWAMDVFALPSLFEGLSVAAVEAQAAGLPVLCAQGLAAEGKLTKKLRFIPLEAGAQAWADAIMEIGAQNTNREHDADAVCAAGFESRTVAQRIKQTYLESHHAAAKDFDYRSDL